MNAMKRSVLTVAVLGLMVGAAGQARANFLVNGDFQTGNLSPWTVFTTPNGNNGFSPGLPNVVPFDTTGAGASNAAQFMVGQNTLNFGTYEGGGISQTFTFGGGDLRMSADVAAFLPSSSNGFGGRFELLLNNVVKSTFEVGPITANQTIRGTLLATELGLGSGSYILAIRVTRPVLNSSTTPFQYVDNIVAELVPEPSTVFMAGTAALFGLVAYRRRKRVVA